VDNQESENGGCFIGKSSLLKHWVGYEENITQMVKLDVSHVRTNSLREKVSGETTFKYKCPFTSKKTI
jgi:hypothetical protein